ncbi:MAG TPA: Ig-like domain-containing protein [Candidatus Saccharimonadales bacterium]|nr:Ig-like domain-containing protein [Candidatus Saccharimonadales bacterium]
MHATVGAVWQDGKMKRWAQAFLAGTFVVSGVVMGGGRASAAACTVPATDYGKATTSMSVPGTATYRIWSRIMAPDTTNHSYLLQVDGSTCYNVGGASIPANTWTWVDYQGGNTGTKVQQSLSQGAHALVLLGNAPGVKVDRVIATSDTACVPTGNGDNCNVPSDTTPPVVTLTAPAEGANVSGNVTLTASASDNTGVTKVEFYDNTTLVATDTTSPYSTTWDTSKVANGSHLITARAYDAAGNVSSDANTVSAKNGDTQAPSTPGSLSATATSYHSIDLKWKASTDNTGVTGYTIMRDGVPIAKTGAVTSYTDNALSANTGYSYQLQAFDAAGNVSALSSKVSATTQKVADSTPPSAPTALQATPASTTQINLSWTAATDNIGVVSYTVYRASGSAAAEAVGTSTTNTYGDSNLSPSTSYTYYVVAKDASNNASQPSASITAETLTPPPANTQSKIMGTVTNQKSGKAIAFATVVIIENGRRHTYQADKHGRYAIFHLDTGRYNLTFRARGYYSKTVSVSLTPDPVTQNMSLKKK